MNIYIFKFGIYKIHDNHMAIYDLEYSVQKAMVFL